MNRLLHSRRSLLRIGAATTILSLVPGVALAATFHIKVTVRYKDGPAAANARITVKELLSGNPLNPDDDTTWEFRTNADGVAEGDLRNRRTVQVPDPTLANPLRTRTEDDALDNPTFKITAADDFGNSADALELSWNGIGAVTIELPTATGDKRTVGRIFRRKSLVQDFTAAEQQELSDLILGFLNNDLISMHMDQVDHLDNLFTDHRSYLFEMEKKLLQGGHRKYVPLPIWDPLDDLPPGWHRVHSSYAHMPLRLHNARPRFLRTNLPSMLRPENLAANNFATAHDLALAIGRTAGSAPHSYHFWAHADLAGPFSQMKSAGAAVMFWGFHGVLVDVYEKWLSTVMPGRNRQTALGRHGDGRLELFTVSSDHRLWHSWQRLKTPHRHENDDLMQMADVKFPHWSHWQRLGDDGRDISDVSVSTDHAGRIVVLARAKGSGQAFDRLQLLRLGAGGWGSWQSLDVGTSFRDYAAVRNSNNTLDILCIRAKSGQFVISKRTETGPGSNSFSDWQDITEPGWYYRLAVGAYQTLVRNNSLNQNVRVTRPHIAVSTSTADPVTSFGQSGQMYHLWRSSGGWSAPWQLADDLYRSIAIGRNLDRRPEIFAIRNSDEFVYHRWIKTASSVPFTSPMSDESWSGWTRLGSGQMRFARLALGQNKDGRLEVFATDIDGRVWHIWQVQPNSGWSDWAEIPRLELMGRAREPMSARDHSDRLKVFVNGDDNFTYMAEQNAPNQGPWHAWTNI